MTIKRSGFDLDVRAFEPDPDTAKIEKAAEVSGFTRRGPQQSTATPARRRQRAPTQQFNQRATIEAVELFYRIAEEQNWDNRRTLDEAIKALSEKTGIK